MSRIGLIFLFVLSGLGGYAQQEYFVLIQADNDQPFYVRMREQTLSSSSQGHLILSQLKDSIYRITIGFPKKLYPEQDFYFVVDGKDLGFRLKWLDAKGWALFNIQTEELEMPSRMDTIMAKPPLEGVKKDDAFSQLMAGVVNDTAVMYNTYAMEAYLKDSSAHPAPDSFAKTVKDSLGRRIDSSAGKADSAGSPTNVSLPAADSVIVRPDLAAHPALAPTSPSGLQQPITAVPASAIAETTNKTATTTHAAPAASVSKTDKTRKPARVEKLSEQQTSGALRLTYADHAHGHRTDTIEILIPRDTIAISAAAPIVHKDVKDSVKRALTGGLPGPAKEKPVLVNSDCRNFATEADVDKLKAKLQAIPTDEAKILAARKLFKLKCLSTSQLKGISDLFTQEEGKFRFLEAAYPFVSDDRFGELSGLFMDPVWQEKFKAMTGGK